MKRVFCSFALAVLCLLQASCSKHPPAPVTASAEKSSVPAGHHDRLLVQDLDGDWKLSFDEWAAPSIRQFEQYLAPGATEITPESALAFLKARRDHAKSELAKPAPEMRNPRVKQQWEATRLRLQTEASMPDASLVAGAQGLVKTYDRNKDGKVSRNEWLAPLREKFSAIDTNRDHFLSNDELLAFDKKMSASAETLKH